MVILTEGPMRISSAAVLVGCLIVIYLQFRRFADDWGAMSEQAKKKFLGRRWDS